MATFLADLGRLAVVIVIAFVVGHIEREWLTTGVVLASAFGR